MKILATNPDTIGDVLLRQPMYRALSDAGHDLMLIVRPLLAPLVALIAPGARVHLTEANVYDPRLIPEGEPLDAVAAAAREFDPDVLLVAPFQWTALEERLAADLPRSRVVAMTGRRFADPEFGPAPASVIAPAARVSVTEDMPEVRKNELLAGAVLGRAVTLPDPAIEPAREQLAAGAAALARLGLEAGTYWAACVGETQWTQVRNWRADRWAAAMAEWATRGHRFLLIGHESEAQTSRVIQGAMGDQSGAAVVWSGQGEGDLDTLLGLIAHARGYVGRDTGPMHLAAAMGKPVLAVFGGGTWPRFLPACDRSIALAVGVPCVGCGWTCELPESYCIKDVPLGEVQAAFEALERGAVKSRTVKLLDPGPALLARIGREAAAGARAKRVELSVSRREHMEQSQAMTAVLERSVKRAGEADRLGQELDALRAEMTRREAILRKRLAAAENLFRSREADFKRKTEELEASEASVRAQLEAAAKLERGRMEEIVHLRQELVKARAEAEDARLVEARMRADQGTLTALSRQQEADLGLLRQRLHDLMQSRWRKYGQRLRLCMTMPWEAEMTNGHR